MSTVELSCFGFIPFHRLLQLLLLSSWHVSFLDCTVSAATTSALNSVEYPTGPVLHQIRNVPDGVPMGQKVPASSAVPIVVEPRSKDQVSRNTKKHAVTRLALTQPTLGQASKNTYIMTNQVKKPQWVLPLPSSSPLSSRDSQACFVYQVSRNTFPSFSSL